MSNTFEEQVLEKVYRELIHKTWGMTTQFLQVHTLDFEGDRPKISRIDTDNRDDRVVAYLPVKDASFYMTIYFDNKNDLNLVGVGTEPNSVVYFRATSQTMAFSDVAAMTTLKATHGWSKGDRRKSGSSNYTFSSFCIEPNPEPDAFEDKFRKILDVLETDKEGIKRLTEKTMAGISVAMTFHNGNGMFGGPHLDHESIKRLGELNLSVDFDLYARGNPFTEP